MTLDWDGKIRMDPSSPYAMQRLIGLQGPLRRRLRLRHRPRPPRHRHARAPGCCRRITTSRSRSTICSSIGRGWRADAAVGKTRGQQQHDRSRRRAARAARSYEVPVGFKWFVDGLLDGSLGFGGEESAGASFLRRDGTRVDDRQGRHRRRRCSRRRSPRAPAAIPASSTASSTRELGEPVYERIDAPATPEQKTAARAAVARAGADRPSWPASRSRRVLDQRARQRRADRRHQGRSPTSGWFAARPSGTEDIYKIYAESFRGADHLHRILQEAQALVDATLAS